MASPTRRMARSDYDDDDYYDDYDDYERRPRRRKGDLTPGQIAFYIIVGLLPIGVPILAFVFRPLAGFGPDLSVTWAVLLSVVLICLSVVCCFAIPSRKYMKSSFMIACAVLGYIVFGSLMAVRLSMVVGWNSVETEEEQGRLVVAMPVSVEFKKPKEGGTGEFFTKEVGAFTYSAGYREVSSAQAREYERILKELSEIERVLAEGGNPDSDLDENDVSLFLFLTEAQRNGWEITTKELEAQGFPGRRFAVKGQFAADAYLVNNRVYHLVVTGETVNENAITVKKFLSSFKLKDPPKKQDLQDDFGGGGEGGFFE